MKPTYGSRSAAVRVLEWLDVKGVAPRKVLVDWMQAAPGGSLTLATARSVLAAMLSSGMLRVGWGLLSSGRDHLEQRKLLKQTESLRFFLLEHLDEEGFATVEDLTSKAGDLGYKYSHEVLSWLKCSGMVTNQLIEMTEEGRDALKQSRKARSSKS